MTQPNPQPAPQDSGALAQALALTRESLAALQRMQEQQAALHRQFLDGQDAAQRTMALLIEQQQRLLTGAPAVALPPLPAPAPVPTNTPPPPPKPAPVPVAPPPAHAGGSPGTPEKKPAARAQQILLEVIAEKTGYPAEMLGMGMSLDADLGIDSIKRVEILSALQDRLPDAPQVKAEHHGTLLTLADIAAFLAGPGEVAPTRPTPPPDATERPAALDRGVVRAVPLGPRPSRPFKGGVRVFGDGAGLAGAEPVAALIVVAPKDADDAFCREALMAVKAAGPALRAAKGVLLTVSRIDGAFGFAGGGGDPLGGALAGLAKTAGHEWPEVSCRALDLHPDHPLESVMDELTLGGPSEVGLSPRGAVTLERVHEPLTPGTFVPFRAGDLVVISGGARGVTAEAALALARRFRPTLLLLGRSPEPAAEPDWLSALPDEAALKRELAKRNPGRTPRQVGDEVKAVLAGREVRHTLERVRQAGARAIYRSVDIRDHAAVAAAVAEARQAHGPVRGVVHGAGVLADALIADKTAEQFDAVWGTKVGGLRALLAATAEDDLKAVALFSSSTARFGRTGQVDYAMANEALNKLAGRIAAERPGCRVVSLNWGPWAGGMVTPGLAGLFAKEGVGLIPLADGAALLADELTHGPGGPREVVVLASGTAAPTPAPPPPPVAFERSLTLDDHPVLADHVLNGCPVLPLALMLEWMVQAALVQNAGLTFHGADGLRVLKGVILDGGDIRLHIAAGKTARRDGLFVAPAEVRSTRGGKEVLHARAEILLANSLPPPPEAMPLPAVPAYPHDPYGGGLLFHGEMLHAIASVEGVGPAGVAATLNPAAVPARWMRRPLRQAWITDPLAIDGVFQLMILWTRQERGAASLPTFLKSYRQYRRSFPPAGCRVVLRTDAQGKADFDLIDAAGAVIAHGEGYECVTDASLGRAFGRNRVAAV